MIKVDLHTHSIASHDGGITERQYRDTLNAGTIDCVAITDHNRIDFALQLQKELGQDKVIVGEEILTREGDIIGLFLHEVIPPHLTLNEAIQRIKAQNGIVYIPHPFENVRKGIAETALETIKDQVDLIESANGRAYFQNFGPKAHAWAHLNRIASFASSDAHRWSGLGKTYTTLTDIPTAATLVSLAKTGRKTYKRPQFTDILAPKMNKVRKKFGR